MGFQDFFILGSSGDGMCPWPGAAVTPFVFIVVMGPIFPFDLITPPLFPKKKAKKTDTDRVYPSLLGFNEYVGN
ncbi:MAG: hypothetical protein WC799_03585 [Desulfobacteraceae bacterium]